jgi:hypothetical protein
MQESPTVSNATLGCQRPHNYRGLRRSPSGKLPAMASFASRCRIDLDTSGIVPSPSNFYSE